MSSTFITTVHSVFTDPLISKFASLLGEQENNTRKAVNAAVPMVLICLLHKVGYQQEALKIYDVSKQAAGNDFFGHIHELSTSPGGLTAGSALLTKGADYTGAVLADRTDPVIKEIARYADITVASASFITGVACFAALDAIGRQIANSGLDVNGMIAWLATQRSSVISVIPSGLHVKEALAISHYPGEQTSGAGRNTTLFVVIAVVIIAILVFIFYRSCNKTDAVTTTTTRDTVVNSAPPAPTGSADTAITLPGGQMITIQKGSTEDRLISFLNDPSAKVEKNNGNWFNFTNISFDRNSANLLLESEAQLKNIVAILHAFPKAEIKISGYADNVGDSANNTKLSQQRADNVLAKLKSLGANASQLRGAKGYGPAYPIGDNGTEEGRAMNRRMAINVVAK